MGRYVDGDHGFRYKYAFGDQPSELVYLASQAGAGRASLFLKLDVHDGDEIVFRDEFLRLTPFDEPGEAFARRAAALRTAMAADFFAPSGELEYPLKEEDRESDIDFVAAGLYDLPRADWPALLDWINGFLPLGRPLSLDDLRRRPEGGSSPALRRAKRRLDGEGLFGSLAYLGLEMLSFAVRRDLESFGAEDTDSIFTAALWSDGAVSSAPIEALGDPDHERRSYERLAARADGVVLTPAPRSVGAKSAVDQALSTMGEAVEEALITPAREHLGHGAPEKALPHVVAALQWMPPTWRGAPALRTLAREAIEAMSGRAPDLDATATIVDLFVGSEVPAVAVRAVDRLRALGLDAGVALALRAYALAASGHRTRAQREARAAIETAGAPVAHAALGLLAHRRKAHRRAVNRLRRALDGGLPDPLRSASLTLLAESLEQLGKPRAAIRRYQEAIVADSEAIQPRFQQAVLLDRIGRPRAAINAYTRLLRVDPSCQVARFNRACEYARVGDRDRAIRDLRRLLTRHPKWKESAREERYFDAIREDPEFARLIEP